MLLSNNAQVVKLVYTLLWGGSGRKIVWVRVSSCAHFFSVFYQKQKERWQSGRLRRSWKPLSWEAPGVRIPLSPPKNKGVQKGSFYFFCEKVPFSRPRVGLLSRPCGSNDTRKKCTSESLLPQKKSERESLMEFSSFFIVETVCMRKSEMKH